MEHVGCCKLQSSSETVKQHPHQRRHVYHLYSEVNKKVIPLGSNLEYLDHQSVLIYTKPCLVATFKIIQRLVQVLTSPHLKRC